MPGKPDAVVPTTSVIWPPRQRLATYHRRPFQCKAYPPYSLTAQTSSADGALASLMNPVSRAGNLDGDAVRPLQRRATGTLAPPGFVPPKTQATRLPAATMTE